MFLKTISVSYLEGRGANEKRCCVGPCTHKQGMIHAGVKVKGNLICSDDCSGETQDPERREQGRKKDHSSGLHQSSFWHHQEDDGLEESCGKWLWRRVQENSLIFQVSLISCSGMANPYMGEIKERWQKDAWMDKLLPRKHIKKGRWPGRNRKRLYLECRGVWD